MQGSGAVMKNNMYAYESGQFTVILLQIAPGVFPPPILLFHV
jgi:hypothetical protein